MLVNVNEKAQSKFSAQVERRHIKFTEKGQRQKAKKRCTSQGKKPKGSTSLGAKVNGNECNRGQVYEQCKQLCYQGDRKKIRLVFGCQITEIQSQQFFALAGV